MVVFVSHNATVFWNETAIADASYKIGFFYANTFRSRFTEFGIPNETWVLS